MHWSLCCARVCLCVCLWACDLVRTSQFKPTEDPRPPSTSSSCSSSGVSCLQLLHVCFPISRVSVLSGSKRGSSRFFYYFCRFGLLFQVCRVQFCGLAEVWRIQGEEEKQDREAEPELSCWKVEGSDIFVTLLLHVEPSCAEPSGADNSPSSEQCTSHKMQWTSQDVCVFPFNPYFETDGRELACLDAPF